jgi:hypothetical protein
MEIDIATLLDRASSGTDADIANVVYALFKDNFICNSIKNNSWYKFCNNEWIICDSAYSLKILLSSVISQEFSKRAAFWSNKILSENDEYERDRYRDKAEKLLVIAIKLKMTSFKENIIKESCELFYKADFNF